MVQLPMMVYLSNGRKLQAGADAGREVLILFAVKKFLFLQLQKLQKYSGTDLESTLPMERFTMAGLIILTPDVLIDNLFLCSLFICLT